MTRIARMFRFAVSVCLLTATGVVTAASPPQPWPGPDGFHAFIEAEHMRTAGEGWEPVPGQGGFYSPIPSGELSLSGQGGGEGVAVEEIEIPAQGVYQFALRYSSSQRTDGPDAERDRFRGPFAVSITQDGAEVFYREYDTAYEGELPDGGRGVGFRWGRDDVELAAGTTRIELRKLHYGNVYAGTRRIDCILITDDLEYEPNHRDFEPQTYVRLRMIDGDPLPLYVHAYVNYERHPFRQHLHFDARGLHEGVNAPRDAYLQAGETAAWVNLSRQLRSGYGANWMLRATVRYHNPEASSSHYAFDFATRPEEDAIVKTIERRGEGSGLMVRIPPDLTDGQSPMTDADYAEQTREMIARLPRVDFGNTPQRFPLLINMPIRHGHNTPGVRDTEMGVLEYLGVNGLMGFPKPGDETFGVRFGRARASMWALGPGGIFDPDTETMDARLRAATERAAALSDQIELIQVKVHDERTAIPLDRMANDPGTAEPFAEWLRERNVSLSELGAEDWSQVRMTADRDTPHPALYYYSQRFRAWSIGTIFAHITQRVREHFPGVPSAQNFSEGTTYRPSFFDQGIDYFDWFGRQATDAAHSGDWAPLAVSPQVNSWNMALYRAAVRRHGQPMHAYLITSFGRPPADVKRSAVTLIAQGVKAFGFYEYRPVYAGMERTWYHNWPMHAAVAELTREIGAAEHLLMDAQPVPAQTAMLLSTATDIWNTNHDVLAGHERMHTHLALLHDHVPSDVLGDDDVIEGRLADYRLAFAFGEQWDARVLEKLVEWVHDGGTLVLGAGAATRDHFNQPTRMLDDALELGRGEFEVLQPFNHAGNLIGRFVREQAQVLPVDRDGEGTVHVPVRGHRHHLAAGEDGDAGEVLTRFDDGEPATVLVERGRGRVVMLGYLPAVAYAAHTYDADQTRDERSVKPLQIVAEVLAQTEHPDTAPPADIRVSRREHTRIPPFDADLRRMVTWPVALAGIDRPLRVNGGMVEATWMTSTDGWVVPLANYTDAPLDEITVTVEAGERIGQVTSARLGPLAVERDASGAITFRLPLESTDFVFGTWNDSEKR